MAAAACDASSTNGGDPPNSPFAGVPPMSPDERAAVELQQRLSQLQDAVMHFVTDECTLSMECRELFLRDEQNDVAKAAQRIAQTMIWRVGFGADRLILGDPAAWAAYHQRAAAGRAQPLRGVACAPPPTAYTASEILMRHYWPGWILGIAYDGTAVQLNRFSRADLRTIVRDSELFGAAIRHSVYLNELARWLHPAGQMTMIFDLGVSEYERVSGMATDTSDALSAITFLARMNTVLKAHSLVA